MPEEQLAERMLCSSARVDSYKVRTGHLESSDWPRLKAAAGRLSEAPIFIDDTLDTNMAELRAKARGYKEKEGIKMVVIDYLQLMRESSDSDTKQKEALEISRSLKALAKDLQIPVIVTSQLSRDTETRENHRPRLSDLKGWGGIEQDADLAMFIFREEYYDPTPENCGLAEIILAKNRGGPVGSLKLMFQLPYSRFENIQAAENN